MNIVVKGRKYTSVKALKKNPSFEEKYSRNVRNVIKDLNISSSNYQYFSLRDNKIFLSKSENRKAILYFTDEYYHGTLLPMFEKIQKENNTIPHVVIPKRRGAKKNNSSSETVGPATTIQSTPEIIQEKISKPHNQMNVTISSNENILPIIILNEEEKILLNGKRHNLIMRGERHYKKIFISVFSVGKMFGVKRLENDLTKNAKKSEGENYVMLKIDGTVNGKYKTAKKAYFTYYGFLTYIFTSKKANVTEIRDHFEEILFTHQFGTIEQKTVLVKKLAYGVPANEIKKVLKIIPSEVACIYLLVLGTVKDLRKEMDIDDSYTDDLIICKFGRTNNLDERLRKHTSTFSKFGCNISVRYITIIDSSECVKAEAMIKKYIKDEKISFSFSSFKELAIVDKHTLNNKIKEQYTLLQKIFCTENKHLNVLLKEYEHKLEKVQLEHKVEITKYESSLKETTTKYESSLKETTTKYESSLKETTTKYEIEIQRLKYELEIEKMKAKLSKYEK